MPKLAKYALVWADNRGEYDLHEGSQQSLMVEAHWIGWLQGHRSFSFIGRSGRLSLLKERRKAGYDYWYAYRRHGNHVVKRYAGRSEELTFERLEKLSQALTEKGEGSFVPQPTTTTLLVSKLRLPPLPPSLVARERLLKRLDAGRAGRLTVVSAPAGFGKTTLVRQWLWKITQESATVRIAWLSLDANDNHLLRFWRYLITVCRVFADNIGSQSLPLLDASLSIQSAVEMLPMVFVNELDSIPDKGILVLEDYDVITVSLIHQALNFVLEHLPPTLHVILITRSTPPLPLARLRAANQVTEIEAPDLRFSESETSAFLQLYSPLPLPLSELRKIEARIEGWAAGLRLLTLALQGHDDPKALGMVLSNFASGGRAIGDYFVTEVLNNQPESLQQFLLQTSFLDSLTASLCDSVTLRNDSELLLEALEQANLFLEPLDGIGLWYRYHALFATAMQAEAKRRFGEAAISQLAERAGYWYEARGMIDQAINAAIKTNDTQRAADLIGTAIEHKYGIEQTQQQPPEFHTLASWLAHLPRHLVDERPLLSLAVANTSLFASKVEMRVLNSAEEADIERALRNAERGFQLNGAAHWLNHVYANRALLSREQGQLTEAMEWSQKALPLLPPQEVMWRSFCLSILGQGKEFSGDLGSASERVAEAYTLCIKTGNRPMARLHGIMLGRVYVEQHKFQQASSILGQVLHGAREANDLADIGEALCGLAQLALYGNDLDSAWKQAQEAVEVAHPYPHLSSFVNATLILARIEYARDDIEAALARCETLLAARTTSASVLEKQIDATIAFEQASIALSAGDLNTAKHWWANRPHDLEQSRVRRDEDEMLLARLLIAEGNSEDAAQRLESLIADAEREGRARIELEACVWLALAREENGQQEACNTLATALTYARPVNAQRAFLDGGEPLIRLLRTILPLLEDKRVATFAKAVLHAGSTGNAAPNKLLSSQEQLVLSLIAEGHSNAAIAATLVVSVNTVKAHVKAIYRKLEVSTRVDAVRVAHDLGLL